MPEFLYISHRLVSELVDDDTIVRIAEEILRAQAAGQTAWTSPPVVRLQSERVPAGFRVKLASVDTLSVVGCRVMGNLGAKAAPEFPQSGVVLLADPRNGQFLALVDEHRSYALRTGASAAVALRFLADPRAETAGLIGAGVIGRGVARALRAALPLRRLFVHDVSAPAIEALNEGLGAESRMEVIAVDSAEAVLGECEAVVVATTAARPFIKAAWVRPGSTICSLGEHQELETAAYLQSDKLIVDDWDHVGPKEDMRTMLKAGELDESRVYGNLAEVVAGVKPGRERASERILVRTAGLATMDVAVAHWVYQQALERGLGQRIET
jgi:ornithine cyclodeaminase/alanine dehydrogenase-like protein (mu-crystallin family)